MAFDGAAFKKSRKQKADAFGRGGARFVSDGKGRQEKNYWRAPACTNEGRKAGTRQAVLLLMNRGVSPNAEGVDCNDSLMTC